MNKILSKLYAGYEFEKHTVFYHRIGVRLFKKIVPTGGDIWIRLINKTRSKKVRLIKNRDDAIMWIIFTLGVECLHGVGFLVMNYFIIHGLINQQWRWVSFLMVLNIFINLYPIFTQRYNRIRIVEMFNITLNDLKIAKIEIRM